MENLRDTERPWTDEPHALATDFILASLVSAELLTSSKKSLHFQANDTEIVRNPFMT